MLPFPSIGRNVDDAWRWIFLGGVGALFVLVVTVGGWTWWTSYRSRGLDELELATLRVRAVRDRSAPAQARAEAAKALQALIDRYPRLKAVPQAAYQLGNLHYQNKAFEEARRAYQLALDRGATGALATLCHLGIAYAWEAQGEYARALGAFEAAGKGLAPQDFLYEEALLGVARSHELLKEPERAREAYQRLLKDVPQSRRAEEVRARLASLAAAPRP